ncbi:zinc ribbon domain-containing protein [Corynebacterium sp. YSMAA1_1_F7]|uniref:zinc ribbon domain-containing protein n=1 Tax=Corynebacterium sp. YSMAA1_1_F7 TaxID=3383590 RepID=UPI0038D0FCE7
MRWTTEDRKTLTDLARDQEELSIAQARLDSLPEQAKLEELQAQKREDHRQQVLNNAQLRSDQATIKRLRQDVAKLKQRERANVAGLGAQTDPERRRDLKHDLHSTRDRLQDLEHRLERSNRVQALFSDTNSAADEADSQTHAQIDEDIATARTDLERATSALHADISAIKSRLAQRRTALEDTNSELLRAYDQQLSEHGVGAAPLKGRTCQACFMELDPLSMKELDALAASGGGEVPRCPECNVLLLR